VVGSVILMDTDLPGFQIAAPVIAAVAVSSAALMIFVLGMVMRSVRRAVVTGLPHLIGETARVERVDDGTVYARLEGELWQVECNQALAVGDTVKIIKADGLILKAVKQSGGTS
jgi:membrane-bound serine protease (ClpP class)